MDENDLHRKESVSHKKDFDQGGDIKYKERERERNAITVKREDKIE